MTGVTEGASAPPPKKRSFFKKAAWQTEAKADTGKEEDMFSHSNEFRDIVNEEKQRRQKERMLAEEKRRHKPKEQDKKRRKASPDIEASKEPRTGSSSSPQSCRKERKSYVNNHRLALKIYTRFANIVKGGGKCLCRHPSQVKPLQPR